jgi:hypothetical protein
MSRAATLLVWIALPLGLAVPAGCSRLAEHPLVVEAVEEVSRNERVAELLGKPVECSRAIRGSANETDGIAMLQFDAKGPKAAGVVVIDGKKTGGAWGVTMLELRPAGGGEKLSLTADLEERTGTDTPKFDPAAAGSTSAKPPAAPPADVEIKLPPGPPGQ